MLYKAISTCGGGVHRHRAARFMKMHNFSRWTPGLSYKCATMFSCLCIKNFHHTHHAVASTLGVANCTISSTLSIRYILHSSSHNDGQPPHDVLPRHAGPIPPICRPESAHTTRRRKRSSGCKIGTPRETWSPWRPSSVLRCRVRVSLCRT